MAKDKGNKQNKTAEVITSENVMDVVRNGNLIERSMTEQVRNKIKEEQDVRKAEQLKIRVLKASYRRILKLIQLRNKRRINDITLDTLKQSEILEDQLAGFILTEDKIKKHGGKDGVLEIEVLQNDGTKKKETFKLKEGEEVWVPGSITVAEYDEKSEELVADERKKMRESDQQLDKDQRELQNQYPGYFSYSWNW